MPVTATQRQILFVDDDTAFLDTIGQLFESESAGGWKTHLASTTGQALTILRDQAIDVAVIDLRMPVLDGQQFLQLLHRKFPDLCKVILSGFADEQRRTACLSGGAELFLEKPRSSDGLQSVFATLNELVNVHASEGFSGVLRQVGIHDVLQMECLSRNSSVLEISTAKTNGNIYIKNGLIVHAYTTETKGVEAFNQLLGLRGGDFKLLPFKEAPEETIEGQWEFLLMEAARLRDEAFESEAQESLLRLAPSPSPSTATVPVPAGGAPQSPPSLTLGSETAPSTPISRIQEFLVASPGGEVLYEWQSEKIENRLKLFDLIGRSARKLGQTLPLGEFDRVEFNMPNQRLVALIKPDRHILVVSVPNDEQPPS